MLDCQPEAPRGSRPHFTTPTLEPSGSRTSFFFTPLLPRGVCLKWPDTLHLAEEPEDLSLNSKMFFSRQVKDPIFSQEGGGGAGTSVGTLRPSFLLVLFQTGWKIRFSPPSCLTEPHAAGYLVKVVLKESGWHTLSWRRVNDKGRILDWTARQHDYHCTDVEYRFKKNNNTFCILDDLEQPSFK